MPATHAPCPQDAFQGNDDRRHTCYGCHQHSPESLHRKHLNEGIGDDD